MSKLHDENAYGCVRIVATSTALPDRRVSNAELVQEHHHAVAAAAMAKLTGVSERRVADNGSVDSDLLLIAAERCLARANRRPEELSKLLVTKFLGDRALPPTASLLQRKLRSSVAVQSYDVDGGVNAFLQALDVAACTIGIGDGPVLIVSGGIVNRLVSRTDPRLAFLYGDGAAAVLLEPSQERYLLSRAWFSNPDYLNDAVGFSVRADIPEDLHETKRYDRLFELYRQSDWKPAREYLVGAIVSTAEQLLSDAGQSWRDIDLVLMTENHWRLWLEVQDRLGIEPSKRLGLLGERGNTMSAMLPMLLDRAISDQRIGKGSLVMLLSIGEGISGGGILLRL